MGDQQLDWQRYLLLMRYNWRFLLVCALGGLLVGVFLNLFILKPMFASNGKLLIKGGKAPTFVAPLKEESQEVRALTQTGNPLLTQIEVLNSIQLAQRVLEELKATLSKEKYQEYFKRFNGYFEPENLAEGLKLKNPASTDIITLNLKTPDRDFSRLLVDQYITSYKSFLQEINSESLEQQSKYIRRQIRGVEGRLKAVRDELKSYRQASKTIDLPNEAQASIQQLSDLETQRIQLDSQISAHRGTIANLRRQLGMSSKQAVQSVALGMNASLADTQRALDTALQEYQTLSVKYTDENPAMVALKARIQEIQKQLAQETARTIGVKQGNGRRIADPVRSNLVNNLTATEAQLQGLVAQRAALAANINRLKEQSQMMPEKQMRLAELLESEKVLSDMLTMLQLKAAEAELQASNGLSNVVVVQPATRPLKADFPRPLHVALMMLMIGLLGGMARLIYLEWLRMQAIKPIQSGMGSNPSGESKSLYSTKP